MAAANASIGVARAAFFPTVMLNGAAGFQSVNAGTVFNWPSRMWSLGPSISAPLFEGGSLRAGLRQAQAAYDEAVANYRQTVLSAFADVEDNLAAQQLLAVQFEAETAALASTPGRRWRLRTTVTSAGLVTYLEVATAQNNELDQEQQTVRVGAERLVTTVGLIKAAWGRVAQAEPAPH